MTARGTDAVTDVVGLVPAAGFARRLGDLPCSKEILPVGVDADGRPRAACETLLAAFRRGGVGRAVVLLRRGKGDVADYLGDGSRWGVDLAYRFLAPTPSVPATLAAAAPFLGTARVALGFPDILFTPDDAFAHLLARQEATGADLVLGLFPTDQPEKTDMVELDAAGRPARLVIKQPDQGLRYTWSIAVWGPRFTRHLVEEATQNVAGCGPEARGPGQSQEGGPEARGPGQSQEGGPEARGPGQGRGAGERRRELWVGEVIASAIGGGLAVDAVCFDDGSYLDVGTAEDLARARAASRDAAPRRPGGAS